MRYLILCEAKQLGLRIGSSSWCFYLLVVDYNISDADVYTLQTVTIFLLYDSTLILVFILLAFYFQYKSQEVTTVIASPPNKCLKLEVFSSPSKETSLSRHITYTCRLYH